MYRKLKAVSGIRRCLKDWRKAVVALLAPDTDELPPMSQRVALLKELAATDDDWKARVKAFFADIDKTAVHGRMASLGLKPAERAGASEPTAPEPATTRRARLQSLIRQTVASLGQPDEKLRLSILDEQFPEIRGSEALLWSCVRAMELKDGIKNTVSQAYIDGLIDQETANA